MNSLHLLPDGNTFKSLICSKHTFPLSTLWNLIVAKHLSSPLVCSWAHWWMHYQLQKTEVMGFIVPMWWILITAFCCINISILQLWKELTWNQATISLLGLIGSSLVFWCPDLLTATMAGIVRGRMSVLLSSQLKQVAYLNLANWSLIVHLTGIQEN